MAKHIVKGLVHYSKNRWSGEEIFEIFPFDMSEHDRILIGEQEFEIEVPDDFNPTSQLIAGLEEQKRLKRLKLAQELAEIDEQISNLTCIEHVVEA